MQEMKLLIFLKNEFFRVMMEYLKQKKKRNQKKNQTKTNFLNIWNDSKDINYELFKDYFKFESSVDLTKQFYKITNKNKSNELVNIIKSGIIDLKNEINKMTKVKKKLKNQIEY